MIDLRVVLGASVSVLAMAMPAGCAWAQSATEAEGAENEDSQGLGTIVVTAQRREENLQSTPISISAISGEDLRNRDISSPERLAEEIPNISIGDGTGRGRSGAQVSIRGVNEARVSPVLEPGVAIYIDDIYFGRPQTAFLRLFDTERVEVLRGPQGTLFGKNAAGGAIRFVGVRPDFDAVEGYIDVTTGSRERFDARGAINIPLADNLAVRISAGSLNQDGYVRRLSDNYRLGNENTDSVSGKLRWQPVDTVDILISGDYTYSDTDNGAQKLIDYYRFNGSPDTPGPLPLVVCTAANCTAQSNAPLPSAVANWNRYWGNTPLAYAPPIPNSIYQVAGLADISQTTSESYGFALDVNIELGDLGDLRSLTGYRRLDQFNSNDPDDNALVKTFFGGQNDEGTEFWSQELLLNGNYIGGRLNTVTGLYYSVDKPFRNDIRADDGRRRFGLEIERNFQNGRTESRGAFAQATFDVTDALSLTAGIRYTSDKKDYTVSQTVQWDFALAALATQYGRPTIIPTIQTQPDGTLCNTGVQGTECLRVAPLSGGDTFNSWTPRFAAEYQFSDSFMVYASMAKGFKGGGTNDTVADIDTPFAPETIWSYEAGVRTDWLDRRLRINATYFYSEYSDKQITVTTSPNCVNRCTTNVGDAIIQGFEIESRALLFDSFTLYANVGYLDAQWDQITNASAGITLDSPFSRSPKWTVSAGFNHELELSDDLTLLTSAGYSYVSEQESSPQDGTTITIAGRELVNARLGLEAESLDMTFSLFCSNCLDEEYITGGAAWAGGTGNTNGNPLFNVKPDSTLASPLGTAPPSITYVNIGEPRAFGFQIRKRF